MSVLSECLLVAKNESQIKPLDMSVVKKCGEVIHRLFYQYKHNNTTTNDEDAISTSTCYSKDYKSFINLILEKRFEKLFDMMSHHLEKVDSIYWTPKKHLLDLYDDLADFVWNDTQLHKINKYRI